MPFDALEPHQLHVWHAFLPQPDGRLEARQLELLSAQERVQQQRFLFEKDRHRYLTTRALVRTVLSRHAPIEPQDWAFEFGPYGRPHIVNRHPLADGLRFNVSHADGLVVLAVSNNREVGIDTESTSRDAPLEVADRYFSKQEARALRALPIQDQARRFWELWTFKESYIKARGMGLSLPLDQFSFHLDKPGEVSIELESSLNDTAARWSFHQFMPDSHHLVALCAERTPTPMELTFHAARPLDAAAPQAASITRLSVHPRVGPSF